jgi:hypothetical protein
MVNFFYLYDIRYISCIISILMLGSLMKIFKFQNMKNATLFLLICCLTDIINALASHYTRDISYDNIIISYLNSPFLIEAQSFNTKLYKKCSWMPLMDFAFIGLLISYMIRVDKSEIRSRNSYVFVLISYISLIAGSAIWLVITTFNTHAIPYSIFSYTLIVVVTYILAYKRGENSLIWKGEFYDNELFESKIIKD